MNQQSEIIQNCKNLCEEQINSSEDIFTLLCIANKFIEKVHKSISTDSFLIDNISNESHVKHSQLSVSMIFKLRFILNTIETHFEKKYNNSCSSFVLKINTLKSHIKLYDEQTLTNPMLILKNSNNIVTLPEIPDNKRKYNNESVDDNNNESVDDNKNNQKKQKNIIVNDFDISNVKEFINIDYYKNINIHPSHIDILIFYFKFISLEPNCIKKHMKTLCDKKFCINTIKQLSNFIDRDNTNNNSRDYFSELCETSKLIHPFLCCIKIYYSYLTNEVIYNNFINEFTLKFPKYTECKNTDNSIFMLTVNVWIIIDIITKNIPNITQNTTINFSGVIIGHKIISGGTIKKEFKIGTKSWWLHTISDIYSKSINK
jgi:hypothetical protein